MHRGIGSEDPHGGSIPFQEEGPERQAEAPTARRIGQRDPHLDVHAGRQLPVGPGGEGQRQVVELVAVGLGRQPRKPQRHFIPEVRRPAGKTDETVAPEVFDGRDVDLDLHARDVQQRHERRSGIDHLRRREVHRLNIAVGRGIELRVVEFVAVDLQLDAQLPQSGTRLLVIVGRDALPLEELLRARHLILELVVLDLQRLDRQPVVGIVQFGQQLPLAHVVALGDMDAGDLPGSLESQAHLVGRLHHTRKGARRFSAQRHRLRHRDAPHEGRLRPSARTGAQHDRPQSDPPSVCFHHRYHRFFELSRRQSSRFFRKAFCCMLWIYCPKRW